MTDFELVYFSHLIAENSFVINIDTIARYHKNPNPLSNCQSNS